MIFCQLFELLCLAGNILLGGLFCCCYLQDSLLGELDQALPEDELLSCSSLESLLQSNSFKYIIKYFYDHLSNTEELI
jgi:hypothetical protein